MGNISINLIPLNSGKLEVGWKLSAPLTGGYKLGQIISVT